MPKLPRQYSWEKRKGQIILQFRIWYEKGDDKPKTAYRVARALDMRPSYRINQMLNELVEDGKLTAEVRDQSGRWTTKFYLLAVSNTYHGEISRRHIAVKSRGVAVGKLEMFS